MAQIQDSGSNYSFFDKKVKADVKGSDFNLSYLNSFNADFGRLYPVYVQETLPKSVYRLSNQILAYSLPLKSRLMSRIRIFVHYYWQSYAEMFHLWHAFYKKGNDGDTQITLPYVHLTADDTTADSLASYLNVPLGFVGDKIEAWDFFMYQNIFKHYYLPFNILDSDTKARWFPLDECTFELRSGVNTGIIGETEGTELDPVPLTAWQVRPYIDDYFTSALLQPQRGTAPTIGLTASLDSKLTLALNSPFTVTSVNGLHAQLTPDNAQMAIAQVRNLSGEKFPFAGITSSYPNTVGDKTALATTTYNLDGLNSFGIYPLQTYNLPLNNNVGATLGVNGSVDIPKNTKFDFASSINADSIRQLFTTQLELERMARTDGSYREFMQAFYGEIPKNANDKIPTYIGGTVQNISISEVLSTVETSDSPLGSQGGHGVSASEGQVGEFYADDYGVIMGIMSIMPDTYYCQGVEKIRTRTAQEDFFLPGREDLGLEPILNQEIFHVNNNDGTGSTENQGVFGWQDRLDYYRYRQNTVSGKMRDPSNTFWNTMIMTRFFSSLPTLTTSFVNASQANVNHNAWYGGTSESPFIVQIANQCYAHLPIPYRSIPAGLGV